MNDHSDPNPSEGRHNRPADGTEPMETGCLPEDFAQRLERLKEASGLSWRGLGRALGVDPKRLGHWRRGVEPCGGRHALHPPLRIPDARRDGDRHGRGTTRPASSRRDEEVVAEDQEVEENEDLDG